VIGVPYTIDFDLNAATVSTLVVDSPDAVLQVRRSSGLTNGLTVEDSVSLVSGELRLLDSIIRNRSVVGSTAQFTVGSNATIHSDFGQLVVDSILNDGTITLGGSSASFAVGVTRSGVNAGLITDATASPGSRGAVQINGNSPDALFANTGRIELTNGSILFLDGFGVGTFLNGGDIVLGETDFGRRSDFKDALDNRGDILIEAGEHRIGQFANTGTIRATGGILRVDGLWRTSDLVGLHAQGGDISIQGQLDNTGDTYLLDSATGQWTLRANAVGGEYRAIDGLSLKIGSASIANGVVRDTDIRIDEVGNLFLSNTEVINGDIIVGTVGRISLGNNVAISGGNIVLAGNGAEFDLDGLVTVDSYDVLGPAPGAGVGRLTFSTATLRINEGRKIEGPIEAYGGVFGASQSIIENNGTLRLLSAGREFLVTEVAVTGSGTLEFGPGAQVNFNRVAFGLDNGALTQDLILHGGSNIRITEPVSIAPTRIAGLLEFRGPGAVTGDLTSGITRNDGVIRASGGVFAILGNGGAWSNSGAIEIDSDSTVIISGATAFATTSQFEVFLDAASVAGTNPRLSIAGALALDGLLRITLEDPLSVAAGDRIRIISASGGVVGEFASSLMPRLSNGNTFAIEYGANDVYLVAVVPAPGAMAAFGVAAPLFVTRRRRSTPGQSPCRC
jgi:hypothetical protein